MKKLSLILSFCLTASLASGCALASAGMKKGDERDFADALNDVNAGRAIEARMFRAADFKLGGVDVEVAEGVVLLSGNVPRQEDRIEAARIAWSAPRIDQVGNEIMIKGKQGLIRNTQDGLLEKSVRVRLAADKIVKARNYSVETHDGIVYLMGVARTQTELERAAAIASTTRGTKEVISYARVANLPAAERLRLDQEAQAYLAPSAPTYSAPSTSIAAPAPQRQLPDFMTQQPTGPSAPTYSEPTYTAPDAQAAAPVRAAPLSQPIPYVPQAPIANAKPITGPTAPNSIDMGEKLGKELPTDEQLGAYRTGRAGEAVSVIESAPYYIDPDTGKEIPVRFDVNGNMIPLLIK